MASSPLRFPVLVVTVCTALIGCEDGTGVNGTPAAVRKVAGDSVVAPVASVVGTSPVVAVVQSDGAPVKNAVVTFSVADTGSGSVAGGVVRTDDRGRASPVGWNLGRRRGIQRLVARVDGLADSVVFVARAQASGAFTAQAAIPTDIDGVVDQLLPVTPSVRVLDVFGNPVQDEVVVFQVDTSGSGGRPAGTVGGARVFTARTDSLGIASAPWRLGQRAVLQTLGAAVGRLNAAVLFRANARAATPARLSVALTETPCLVAGRQVGSLARFSVTDAFSNVVTGAPVRFSLGDPGGQLDAVLDTSDVAGVVTPGAWRVGPDAGPKTITATLVQDSTVRATASFRASPSNAGDFCIVVRFQNPVSPEIQSAFEFAANRWAQIIRADLPDVSVAGPLPCSAGGELFQLPAGSIVDDLVIGASITSIDGPGSILGSAGPCFFRNSPNALPFYGIMRFDEADIQALITNGNLVTVILHEMGHVLGIGTLWQRNGLLPNPVPQPCNDVNADPRYVGVQANARYRARGGIEPSIAVENRGGCGTANGHWREVTFANELMTGFINTGVANPLSAMTIGTLEDMGYGVSYLTAEDCTGLIPCLQWPSTAPSANGALLQLREQPLDQPPRVLPLDRRGRVYMPRR